MARDKKNISGNIPAVVTPFDEAGRIDLDAFAHLVEWHLSRGVDGICVAGDNGESWSLSVDERKGSPRKRRASSAGSSRSWLERRRPATRSLPDTPSWRWRLERMRSS